MRARRVIARQFEGLVASRAGARLDFGPTLTQGFVEARRRQLGVERAASLEPECRAIAQHDARICGRRPRRPPVDDRRCEGQLPRPLPRTSSRDARCRSQSPGASGGRDRSRLESRGRAARVARSRRCPALRRRVASRGPRTPCTSGGCPVAMVVQTRAGSPASPGARLESARAHRHRLAVSAGQPAARGELVEDARVETIDCDDAHAEARWHDRQRLARWCAASSVPADHVSSSAAPPNATAPDATVRAP